MHAPKHLLAALGVLAMVTVAHATCPCSDASLCDVVSPSGPKNTLAFVTSPTNWPHYPWDLLDTYAVFYAQSDFQPALVCKAHASNTRIVWGVNFPVDSLANATARSEWVQTQLALVQSTYTDGVNVDFESPVRSSVQRGFLVDLIKETTTAFKTANPKYSVSFDAAWSPDCIDGRCYNYAAMAAACDFTVIMAYDEKSQVFSSGPCVAGPNSGFHQTNLGITQFLALGIPSNKLLLGLPFYGYNYPCDDLAADGTCTIPRVPFRGCNCSDAAGTQVPYSDIEALVASQRVTVQWNTEAQSPMFTTADKHQYWFDNATSIHIKQGLAASLNLGGTAAWNVDCLEYGNGTLPASTTAMWKALAGQ